MRRPLLNLRIALIALARHPLRTLLRAAGIAIGVATLVATLCLIEGTRQLWVVRAREWPWEAHATLRVRLPGHRLPGLPEPDPERWRVDVQAVFGARLIDGSTDGRELWLRPRDDTDSALAPAIELWLLERGVPATVEWLGQYRTLRRIQRHIDRLGGLFYAAAALCLLSGAIGMLAVTRTATDQRAIEVAVRRVEGARGTDIAWQFLWESLTICLAGAALAVPIGWLAARIVERQINGAASAFPAAQIAAGAGALVGLGLALGVAATRRAVRRSPSLVLHEG